MRAFFKKCIHTKKRSVNKKKTHKMFFCLNLLRRKSQLFCSEFNENRAYECKRQNKRMKNENKT